MQTITIHSLYDAEQVLYKRRIDFDRAVRHVFKQPANRFGLSSQPELGRIIYFMQGSCDVAYWVQDTSTLAIQDKPRRWGQEALDSVAVV